MKEALDCRVQFQNFLAIIGVGLALATTHLKHSGLKGMIPSCAAAGCVCVCVCVCVWGGGGGCSVVCSFV